MEPRELEKLLDAGRPQPVYLLHGPDRLRLERCLDRFIALLPEEARDFNLHLLSADESPPGAALEQAMTMPFLSSLRVVILRGVDAYSSAQMEPLAAYAANPNETAVLVMTAVKADLRLKFYKRLQERGAMVAFNVPRAQEMVPWVRETARQHGVTMPADAAQALVNRVGASLEELDQELEKLALYVLPDTTVRADAVRAVTRLRPTANVFELGDAIGEQRAGAALAALEDLMQTSAALPTLVMIVRHLRLLLKAVGIEKEGRERDAGRLLGVPPFVVRKTMNQARNFTEDQLRAGLVRIEEAYRSLFTSSAPERLVMESLVLDLASLRRFVRRAL